LKRSPSVAEKVSAAKLVVQNGVGYDTSWTRSSQRRPTSSRKVIDVQTLLGLPDSTPNPHLWYDRTTMPAVATALVKDLSALAPSHRAYFAANARRFNAHEAPAERGRASSVSTPGTPVATTEPVGDYMPAGRRHPNLTPSPAGDIMKASTRRRRTSASRTVC